MINRRVVLITGSIRGIGKETALQFLKRGYFVILNGTRSKEDIRDIIFDFNDYKYSYEYYKFDITNREEIKKSIKTMLEKYKKIDVLVNNAGITRDKSLVKMNEEMWDNVIEVNLTGAFNLCKQIIPCMIKNNYGRVINISSVIALSGNYGQTNYAASKAGLIGFTKSLAQEVAKYGITVNAIAPGFIETDMTKKLPKDIKEKLCNKIPNGKFGTAIDIANTVLFLASESSNYITGETISVNGGLY